MKGKLAYIFIISFFCINISFAQEKQKTYAHTYGLRIGADISKPIRSLLDKGYTGLELVGDYRWSYRYYLAAELGKERKETSTQYFDFTTNGQYIKLGFDYNDIFWRALWILYLFSGGYFIYLAYDT